MRTVANAHMTRSMTAYLNADSFSWALDEDAKAEAKLGLSFARSLIDGTMAPLYLEIMISGSGTPKQVPNPFQEGSAAHGLERD